jgi:hypothetical protein
MGPTWIFSKSRDQEQSTWLGTFGLDHLKIIIRKKWFQIQIFSSIKLEAANYYIFGLIISLFVEK